MKTLPFASLAASLVFAVAACRSNAAPSINAPPAPAAAGAIARWKDAAGGPAWDGLRTMHVVTDVAQAGLRGSEEEWDDTRTGRYSVRGELGPLDTVAGFDGQVVWTEDGSKRSWVVGDRDSRETALTTSFRVALGYWYPERGAARIESAGSAGETSGYDVVRITPAGGRPFELWLDGATHLPSKIVERGDGRPSVTKFSEYRRVGALLLPFVLRHGDGEAQFDKEVRVRRYEPNVAIAETRFTVPRSPVDDLHLPAGAVSTTVPMKFLDGEILIPVRINGKGPFDAILDTGGAASVSPETAAEVGLAEAGAFEGMGSGGSFRESYGHADSLQVGDAVIDRALVSVRPNPTYPQQVVVGHELFQRLTITVDFDANTVTLTRPDAFRFAGRPLLVPFRFQERMPQVDARVDGVEGTFCVDTGQNIAIDLNAPFALEHGFIDKQRTKIPVQSVGAAGLGNTKLFGWFTRAVLAGAEVDGLVGVLATASSAESSQSRYVAGCLGTAFLRRFRTMFDYARQRILLEPSSSFHTPDTFTRSGLALTPEGRIWKVSRVFDGSPAKEAGLASGMTVTSVDGKSADQISPQELRAIWRRAAGVRVTLTFRDGDADRAVTLVLRDLL